MKTRYQVILMFFLLLFSLSSIYSETSDDMITSILERSLISFGGIATIGENFDSVGMGLLIAETHVFLSGDSANGLYLIIFMNSPIRILYPNNVQIDDLKIIGLSYRGESFIPNLGFEASMSISRGSRRIDNTVYGDGYWGISPEIGIYFPHNYFIDFELSVNPMINLFRISSADVLNKSYYDIIFKVNIKSFYKKYAQRW